MKLKISTKDLVEDRSGILYLLVVRLDDGTEVYKVGVTKRKIEERVAEILSSFFLAYRYFPYCKPKKFKKVEDVYAREADMHRRLAELSYKFEKSFGGHTEFFSGTSIEEMVSLYEEVISV